MINRRNFLGLTMSAGAAAVLGPNVIRAFQPRGLTDIAGDGMSRGLAGSGLRGAPIMRAIPSTGETVPAVGLSFSNHAVCGDPAALKEVLRTFVTNGGRVFDAMHGNAEAEQFHTTAAGELSVKDKLFWSVRGTAPGGSGGPPQLGPGSVKAQVDAMLARTGKPALDLVMLPPQGDPMHLAALKEEKKAGRVRYIGVQVIGDNVYPQLETVMRNEPIDFIGVDYDIANRARVEDTILPLALERKIGVMAFFPFGNNGGVSCGGGSNLFGRVGDRPVPEWAADFDATTWAHFFLKYVISHPAVTVARVGTTKAHHMLDNMGGGVGRLPDEATRKRMAEFIDSLPPVTVKLPPQSAHGPAGSLVLPTAVLDRYVGEYRTAGGSILNFRRYGNMLVVKAGPNDDRVIYGQSETRFQFGPNAIEFQLDKSGKATGLIYEQDSRKIAASRVR